MADDLAEINGIKPKIILVDGQDTEVGSKTSSSKYKCKRTMDHYYCTCPAWRNQSGVAVNARTCKHLKELLGDKYETARVKMKLFGQGAPPSSTKTGKGKASTKRKMVDDDDDEDEKPAKKARGIASASKKRKKIEFEDEDEDEDEDEQEEKPAPKAKRETKKPTSSRAPRSAGRKATKKDEDEDAEMADADDRDDEPTIPNDPNDELAVISGVKPKTLMKDGDDLEVSSQTSSSKYKVKRTFDHYYCTCPAWRNQGGVPTNARTCKHLKELLGEKYEAARLKLKNPYGATPSTPSKKSKSARGAPASSASKKQPELLLANKWDLEDGPDPTGWLISEKLDGVRTYWDGKQMISRLGNPFTPPQWLMDKLPKDVTLDGELWGGRGEFQSTVSIVKTMHSPHWKGITFQVFDIPSAGSLPFEQRIEKLQSLFSASHNGTHACKEVSVVEHEVAKSRDHVLAKLKEVERLGGEGLMLRKPNSLYEGRRSATLLKIKTFYDAEARVTGYLDGKGKHTGSVGALQCVMESGKRFNVGTGLSDKQRKNPPKKGAIIVYRFQELTKDGVPRFPSFIGEAADKTKPKDAEIPEHKKALANGGANDDV